MKQARLPNRSIPYTYMSEPREHFGLETVDLVRPPSRFWSDQKSTPTHFEFRYYVDDLEPLPTPAQLLAKFSENDHIPEESMLPLSRRTLRRLQAYFLITEDQQRRLDAREVTALAHQASLVRHVLETPLKRVLIADEVGLGKTIETGLLIQELLAQQPGLRVLYLAPARLVQNVHREFQRLGLVFRRFMVGGNDSPHDSKVIASIHRAAHSAHRRDFVSRAPWDVVVVDECHHLSDWEPGGGNPTYKYALVRDILERMRPDGWLFMLSGTPHQGHSTRFDNLLSLLKIKNETLKDLTGRVIYRTKDDVRDWDGMPLFPQRQIHSPWVLNLGKEYEEWMLLIREFYIPPPSEHRELRLRAAGWRCSQALQWAASSVQAGLGYTVRQALRADWDPSSSPALRNALAALRPYRTGTLNEDIFILFARMSKEIRSKHRFYEDSEEEYLDAWEPDPERLQELLEYGTDLLSSDVATKKWRYIMDKLSVENKREKAVFFAQPVETVTAFARYIELEYGEKPSIIIGAQNDKTRQAEIDSFCDLKGARFLISSKAGGEGINLQVAHQLVHLDIPWNPMDMEQRVGRVHRFGSRRKILVYSVVAENSPETRMYEVAREKLQVISSALGNKDRFESLFSRVMSLIPPEKLQELLLQTEPRFDIDHNRISELVTEGFNTWHSFHELYTSRELQLRSADEGQATWEDLRLFLKLRLKGKEVEGFTTHRFRWSEEKEEIESVIEEADIFCLSDGQYYLCEENYGISITNSEGQSAKPIGLNLPIVSNMIREDAFPIEECGAAWLRWNSKQELPDFIPPSRELGLLVLHRQTLRPDSTSVIREVQASLHAWIFPDEEEPIAVLAKDLGDLLRCLFVAQARKVAKIEQRRAQYLMEQEESLSREICIPTPEDRKKRQSHVCIPLMAAFVAAASS